MCDLIIICELVHARTISLSAGYRLDFNSCLLGVNVRARLVRLDTLNVFILDVFIPTNRSFAKLMKLLFVVCPTKSRPREKTQKKRRR